MGTGLIPADGAIWKARRRAIVPALHKKYVASMVGMFSDSALHGCKTLDKVRREYKPTYHHLQFFSQSTSGQHVVITLRVVLLTHIT